MKKKTQANRTQVLKGRLDRLMNFEDIDRTLGVLRAMEATLSQKAAWSRRRREGARKAA